MMDKQMQELEALFKAEVADHLNTLNRTLLQLETDNTLIPSQRQELIKTLFRAAHSIKGAARTVNRLEIQEVAHGIEAVFEALRKETLILNADIADAIYDGLDAIERLLGNATEGLHVAAILEQLRGLVGENLSGKALERIPSEKPLMAMTGPEVMPPMETLEDSTIRVNVGKLDRVMTETANLLMARLGIQEREREIKQLREQHRRWQKVWRGVHSDYIRLLRMVSNEPNADWQPLLDFLQETQRYMKSTTQRLQQLENRLNDDVMMLSVAADNLQQGVRDMRLLPFETLIGGLQRMVRDMARDLGKQVILQTIGTQIEVDKQVLEKIKDPLMHLLRNAIDHGIETTEIRQARGKRPQGMILLVISQRGNTVSVMIADDGRGIDVERVREKAIEARLITADEVLDKQDMYRLLFQAGISTADQVSAISGRGVGLDVVRENIEALQGQIVVESDPGDGTTFEIMLPISLSTLHCLMVGIGREMYAIPSAAVGRVLFYDEAQVFTVKGQPMMVVDERPTPVVYLADVLERPENPTLNAPKPLGVVLGSIERRYVFVVDDVQQEQEVVVRRLNAEMGRVRNISGATLMGNGRVVLILNIHDLLKSAQGKRIYRRQVPIIETTQTSVPCILVVDDSITTRTLQKNILEAAGYEILIATHGKEALEKLESRGDDIQLMISDIEMPLMNGFELTQQVRQHTKFQNLPIILVTSLDSQENKERGFKAGADAYIVKGLFDQQQLLQTIKNLL